MKKTEFLEYQAAGFNIIPVVRPVEMVDEDPITLFEKLRGQHNNFLLESVEGGERWAQFSILGFNCTDTIEVFDDTITITNDEGQQEMISDDPLGVIREHINLYKAPTLPNLPRFFGGYVGFFAYESAKYAESKIAQLEHKVAKFQEHLPDVLLVKAEELVVFDNLNQTIQMIVNCNPEVMSFEEAQSQLDAIESLLHHEQKERLQPQTVSGSMTFTSNTPKVDFLQAVETVKDYITEGDVMQVVLAQDFYTDFEKDPFFLYQAIRTLNPSPYMYFLELDICSVVGASPEILVRLEDGQITLRPIAGTRKRGNNPEEDAENMEELLNDPKEIAEHLMLIDLGRNDVGRVAKFGSVEVTEKMVIEKYSHVMHIVSNVVGEIKEDFDFIDAIKAALPAGTLSGAPKIRAMEIIHELEPGTRGIYGGAIGHIGWNGNIDTAIAIRTAVIKDGIMHVGAGAGVVADSIPENEWQECKQKAKVFLDALEMIP